MKTSVINKFLAFSSDSSSVLHIIIMASLCDFLNGKKILKERLNTGIREDVDYLSEQYDEFAKVKSFDEKLNLFRVNVKLANKSSLIEIELEFINPTRSSFLISYSDLAIMPFSFSLLLFGEIKVVSSKSAWIFDKYSLMELNSLLIYIKPINYIYIFNL